MNDNSSNIEFYKLLESSLPGSSADERKLWASLIIENDMDIKALSELLHCNKKIALRFAWLLTEIGILKPDKLLNVLPYLLKQKEQIDQFNFTASFATYWSIAGVPLENEAKAIDILFQWILSPDVNTTTKFRAIKVLLPLSKKYSELKNELSLCLNDQIDKHSKDFEKKVRKALDELHKD